MGKKYIYNVVQANFFIQEGVACIETGNNKGNIYWVFRYDDCQRAYEKWNNQNIECK